MFLKDAEDELPGEGGLKEAGWRDSILGKDLGGVERGEVCEEG